MALGDKLTGRLRFAGSVIVQLSMDLEKLKRGDPLLPGQHQRKAEILREAMEKAISMTEEQLSNRLVTVFEEGKNEKLTALITQMIYSYVVEGGRFSIRPEDHSELDKGVDLVNTGLCHLRQSEDGFFWLLSEDLAVSAAIDAMRKVDKR